MEQSLKLIDGTKSRKSNVYLKEGVVYKLFDTVQASYAKPKSDIIKAILGNNYLCDIDEVFLTKDKRLKYKYIPNRKEGIRFCLKDFEPIMMMLDKLHSQGYVHSDVQLPNMVFSETGDAILINFDLTDEIGKTYPHGYTNLSECLIWHG